MGPHGGDPTHNHMILQVITLHPQTQYMFSAGTQVEEENMHFYMDIYSLQRKLAQQKARRQRKGDRILNNKLES